MKKAIIALVLISFLIGASALVYLWTKSESESQDQDNESESSISDQLKELKDTDTIKLQINEKVITLEVARSSEKKAEGLMFREELEGIDGMIFIYDTTEYLQFWMKNTLISLDIIYLDSDLNVVSLFKNTKVNQTNERYPSNKGAQFVIELEGGSSDDLGIKLDSKFSIDE